MDFGYEIKPFDEFMLNMGKMYNFRHSRNTTSFVEPIDLDEGYNEVDNHQQDVSNQNQNAGSRGPARMTAAGRGAQTAGPPRRNPAGHHQTSGDT